MPERDHDADDFFQLWVLIAQTKDALLRAREAEYARYGISNERRAVLYVIESYGGCASPVDIARYLFRELHSVTELLSRMEKDGLVERHKGTGRSKVEVSFTQQGRDVFAQSLHNEADPKLFTALTKRERERLAQYLAKLRKRTLEHLGIPEWQVALPSDGSLPDEEPQEEAGVEERIAGQGDVPRPQATSR